MFYRLLIDKTADDFYHIGDCHNEYQAAYNSRQIHPEMFVHTHKLNAAGLSSVCSFSLEGEGWDEGVSK
jgi:hypothetical protein